MSPLDIRIELMRRDLTISGLAEEFGCYRQQLSMLINGRRVYPALRQRLAAKLGFTVEQLFGTDNRRKAA